MNREDDARLIRLEEKLNYLDEQGRSCSQKLDRLRLLVLIAVGAAVIGDAEAVVSLAQAIGA